MVINSFIELEDKVILMDVSSLSFYFHFRVGNNNIEKMVELFPRRES